MNAKWIENPEWDKTPTNPGFFKLDLPEMKPVPNPILYAFYPIGAEPTYVRQDGTSEIIPLKDRLF